MTPPTPTSLHPDHGFAESSARSPRTRLLRAAAIAPTVLLILVVVGLGVISALLSTSAGSNWVVRQFERQLDGAEGTAEDATGQPSPIPSLTIASSEGTLLWGMTMRDVRYASGTNTISVQTLTSRWNPFTLLSGQVSLELLELNGLRVLWQGTESASPSGTNPLADVLAQLQSTLPTLPFPMNRGLEIVRLHISDANFDLDGQALTIDTLSLGAAWQESELQLRALEFDMQQAAGNPLRLRGDGQIALAAPHSLQLALDWQWAWALDAASSAALPANLPANLPTNLLSQSAGQSDTVDLAGHLSLSGDLNTLIVSHQLSSPLAILSEGTVSEVLANGVNSSGVNSSGVNSDGVNGSGFSLLHSMQAQQIQLGGPGGGVNNQLVMESAQVTSTGWIDRLHLTGTTLLSLQNPGGAPIVPAMTLSWNALLAGTTLTVDQFDASTPTGTLSSTGQINWTDGLAVTLSYNLREQDVGGYQALLPEGFLPGALTSTGSVTLQQSENGVEGVIAIDSLEGDLNGYPLTGGGVISLAAGDLGVDALRLNIGDNELRVSGRWSDEVALDFQLQARDLQKLSPLLDGRLSASGAIAGPRDAPRLNLSATGNNIAAGSQRIDLLQLDIEGQLTAHRLTLAMNSPLGAAALQLSGGIASTGADGTPQTPSWQGRLESGTLRSELGAWLLQSPAALQLSATEASIAQHCWAQAESVLCLQGEWNSDAEVEASASLRSYPLSVFNDVQQETASPIAALLARLPALPAGTHFAGTAAAEWRVNGRLSDNPGDLAVDLRVDLGSGSVTLASTPLSQDDDTVSEQATQQFQWEGAVLTGNRLDNRWQLDTSVNFDQPDLAATGISARGSVRGRLVIMPDQQLDGQLTLAFDDLSWIEAFVRQVQIGQGQLSGLATIAGTLSDPIVGGNLYLRDAAVGIPALGVQISELNSTLSSTGLRDGDGTLTLQGQARSGTGELLFESEMLHAFRPGRSLTLTLRGENVELIRRPELAMTIAPDLTIIASAAGMDMRGLLKIPLLDARITTLPASAIDVSRDTVLVGQSTEGTPVHNAAQTDLGILDSLPLTAQLRVELGEDVHFRGFGLESHLTGAVDITQRATGAPLTYGELTVLEGSYRTYGRSLTIEHGKLLFFGSAENPALDIRAVRRVENMAVGVQMNGTLRDMRSQLFSTPTLPAGDIIAVLLTDRPFAEIGAQDSSALIGAITSLGINQGQSLTNQIRNQLWLDTLAITSTGDTANSSLTLGKYLTPRLFIRYGVGLFETESTLSIDYTLSERFKLEAKSGTTQSVDIKYTVDR